MFGFVPCYIHSFTFDCFTGPNFGVYLTRPESFYFKETGKNRIDLKFKVDIVIEENLF